LAKASAAAYLAVISSSQRRGSPQRKEPGPEFLESGQLFGVLAGADRGHQKLSGKISHHRATETQRNLKSELVKARAIAVLP
jgi:hypothetical protein